MDRRIMGAFSSISDFLRFPGAQIFPEGGYDLDGLCIETPESDALQIELRLGYVYDRYRLVIRCSDQLTWELYIEDSILIPREDRCLAEQPAFSCSQTKIHFEPVPVKLNLAGRSIDARASYLQIQADAQTSPEIRLGLDNLTEVIFRLNSIEIQAVSQLADSWPADEWKDGNTM